MVGSGDDAGLDIRFLNMVYHRLVGQSRGVVHFLLLMLLGVAHIGDIGDGGDDVHVELAVQALLHNLHVQQP